MSDSAHPPFVAVVVDVDTREHAAKLLTPVVPHELGPALRGLLPCDPALCSSVDRETRQPLLSGMGRPHLEIVAATLEDDDAVALSTGKPRVAYRTTIARSRASSYVREKQSGASVGPS